MVQLLVLLGWLAAMLLFPLLLSLLLSLLQAALQMLQAWLAGLYWLPQLLVLPPWLLLPELGRLLLLQELLQVPLPALLRGASHPLQQSPCPPA
jgi:hypothetical protein